MPATGPVLNSYEARAPRRDRGLLFLVGAVPSATYTPSSSSAWFLWSQGSSVAATTRSTLYAAPRPRTAVCRGYGQLGDRVALLAQGRARHLRSVARRWRRSRRDERRPRDDRGPPGDRALGIHLAAGDGRHAAQTSPTRITTTGPTALARLGREPAVLALAVGFGFGARVAGLSVPGVIRSPQSIEEASVSVSGNIRSDPP